MKPIFLSLLKLSTTVSILEIAHARTDLEGCISSTATNEQDEVSTVWYIPDTGEICELPDCGGGRTPRSDNPACPYYTGTATYEPSYLEGYESGAAATTTVKQTSITATATATAAKTKHQFGYDDYFTGGEIDHGSLTITSTPIPSVTPVSSSAASNVLEGSSKSRPSATKSPPLASSKPSPPDNFANATVTFSDSAAGSSQLNVGLGAVGMLAVLVL
ncbi:hypothetical protein BDW62DRAFT_198937 [Aspergillus aurantiobrunneus]